MKNDDILIPQWFSIKSKSSYKKAITRYEEIRDAKKDSSNHKEKILLAYLINKYENTQWSFPDLDPVEIIKIKMDEFGYKSTDLGREYGDKGTISKVLNYNNPCLLK